MLANNPKNSQELPRKNPKSAPYYRCHVEPIGEFAFPRLVAAIFQPCFIEPQLVFLCTCVPLALGRLYVVAACKKKRDYDVLINDVRMVCYLG